MDGGKGGGADLGGSGAGLGGRGGAAAAGIAGRGGTGAGATGTGVFFSSVDAAFWEAFSFDSSAIRYPQTGALGDVF
ncbi:MAG: hypothetical protein JRM73_00585 [Nitrososphaerota archaeon]|nr:hypothetical protein [Nitrososphaerota archaeon]